MERTKPAQPPVDAMPSFYEETFSAAIMRRITCSNTIRGRCGEPVLIHRNAPSCVCRDYRSEATFTLPLHSPLVPLSETVYSPGAAALALSVSRTVFAGSAGATLSTLILLAIGNDALIESPIALLSDASTVTSAAPARTAAPLIVIVHADAPREDATDPAAVPVFVAGAAGDVGVVGDVGDVAGGVAGGVGGRVGFCAWAKTGVRSAAPMSSAVAPKRAV
jgi:hypothetical protein